MKYQRLTLQRKRGERILIGPDIVVEVAGIKGDRVSLWIHAPEGTAILRDELALKIGREAGISWIPSDRKLLPLDACPALMRIVGDIVLKNRKTSEGESL